MTRGALIPALGAVTATLALGSAAAGTTPKTACSEMTNSADGAQEVIAVTARGRGKRALVRNPAVLACQPVLDVSPGLRWVVVAEGSRTYSAKVDGRRTYRLPGRRISHARFSPDGRKIAFTAAGPCEPGDNGRCFGSQVWMTDVTGANARKVSDAAAYAAWAPDSRRLVFIGRFEPDHASGGKSTGVVTVSNVDGTDRRELVAWRSAGPIGPYGDAPWLSWSPRGNWIGYAVRASDAAEPEIRLVRADGKLGRTIARADYGSWSPDGRRLAYARASASLWVAVRDPVPGPYGGLVDWLIGGTVSAAPAWSPNGRAIAYADDRQRTAPSGSTHRIVLVRPDGRRRRHVAGEPHHARILRIFWSRDSKRIAYVREFSPHSP